MTQAGALSWFRREFWAIECGKVPADNDVSGCASKRYKRNSLQSRTELGSKFRGGQNLNKKNSLKYKLAYI